VQGRRAAGDRAAVSTYVATTGIAKEHVGGYGLGLIFESNRWRFRVCSRGLRGSARAGRGA
jgi:hypothetical protein